MPGHWRSIRDLTVAAPLKPDRPSQSPAWSIAERAIRDLTVAAPLKQECRSRHRRPVWPTDGRGPIEGTGSRPWGSIRDLTVAAPLKRRVPVTERSWSIRRAIRDLTVAAPLKQDVPSARHRLVVASPIRDLTVAAPLKLCRAVEVPVSRDRTWGYPRPDGRGPIEAQPWASGNGTEVGSPYPRPDGRGPIEAPN